MHLFGNLHAVCGYGKIVSRLEAVSIKYGYSIYRTNLVKCPPMNDVNKLRNPTVEEIAACIGNLFQEIELLTPAIVLLLGKITVSAMECKLGTKFGDYSGCTFTTQTVGNQRYAAAYHPSLGNNRNNVKYSATQIKNKFNRFCMDATELRIIGRDLSFLSEKNYSTQREKIVKLKANTRIICERSDDETTIG